MDLSGLRLIGIDTCIEGETTGRIDATALRLVQQEIVRQDSAPLIIVMHHPPISPGMRDFDAVARLEGSDQMLEIVRRSGAPQIILAGHVHRPYLGTRHGVACFVTGSPTSAHTSDLPFGNSPIRFEGLQDFYHVHEIDRRRSPCCDAAAFQTCLRGVVASRNAIIMTLTTGQMENLIDAVRDTGRREIMPHFRNLEPDAISTKVDAKDLVTDADRAAELAIARAVSKILPHAVVVGEEAVADRPEVQDLIATADTTVIVDPIDGTGNFVSGLAVFGTILAVVEKGETIFGLLYDPVLDDWIFSARGGGAYFTSDTVVGASSGDKRAAQTRGDKGLPAAGQLRGIGPSKRNAGVRPGVPDQCDPVLLPGIPAACVRSGGFPAFRVAEPLGSRGGSADRGRGRRVGKGRRAQRLRADLAPRQSDRCQLSISRGTCLGISANVCPEHTRCRPASKPFLVSNSELEMK